LTINRSQHHAPSIALREVSPTASQNASTHHPEPPTFSSAT